MFGVIELLRYFDITKFDRKGVQAVGPFAVDPANRVIPQSVQIRDADNTRHSGFQLMGLRH